MSLSIAALQGAWAHNLSFALRFDHHFLRTPVDEELDVVALTRFGRALTPVTLSPSHRARFADGTYRFSDLRDDVYRIEFTSSSGTWTSWDSSLEVSVPLVDPRLPILRDLWPTVRASVPPGQTAVRGKLVGPGAAGCEVEMNDVTVSPSVSNPYTKSDSSGEFLFLVPAVRIRPELEGQIELAVRVARGGKTVTSIEVFGEGEPEHFNGSTFRIIPGRSSRVKYHVT